MIEPDREDQEQARLRPDSDGFHVWIARRAHGPCVGLYNFEFHLVLFDQQSTTETASPASLVSLYLLFISLAV